MLAAVEISAGVLAADHPGRYELVLSNISTPANRALAHIFGTVVKPAGDLVLSGILEQDAAAVIGDMEAVGFEHLSTEVERDWVCIHLSKHS